MQDGDPADELLSNADIPDDERLWRERLAAYFGILREWEA
jgi:hypothetical protein